MRDQLSRHRFANRRERGLGGGLIVREMDGPHGCCGQHEHKHRHPRRERRLNAPKPRRLRRGRTSLLGHTLAFPQPGTVGPGQVAIVPLATEQTSVRQCLEVSRWVHPEKVAIGPNERPCVGDAAKPGHISLFQQTDPSGVNACLMRGILPRKSKLRPSGDKNAPKTRGHVVTALRSMEGGQLGLVFHVRENSPLHRRQKPPRSHHTRAMAGDFSHPMFSLTDGSASCPMANCSVRKVPFATSNGTGSLSIP